MTGAQKRVEAAIQKALVRYLRETSYLSDVRVCAPLNENSHHMLDMGVDVGCTDLILSRPCRGVLHLFYLELKTKTGKLHQSQIDWNTAFDAAPCSNAIRGVAYGYDQGVELIEAWHRSFGVLGMMPPPA